MSYVMRGYNMISGALMPMGDDGEERMGGMQFMEVVN